MYKFKIDHLPKPLADIFTKNTDIHDHNTRHKHDAHVVQRQSKFASQSILHAGPHCWNSIPDSNKQKHSYTSFVVNLKKYYLSKY